MPGEVLMALAQFAGRRWRRRRSRMCGRRSGAGSPGCWAAAMPGRPRWRSSGWRRPASSSPRRRARSWSRSGRRRRSGGRAGSRTCWMRTRRGGGAARPGGGGRGPAARRGGVGGRSFGGGRAGCEHHRVGRRDRGRGDPRERDAAEPYPAGSGAAVAAPGAVESGPRVGGRRPGRYGDRHAGVPAAAGGGRPAGAAGAAAGVPGGPGGAAGGAGCPAGGRRGRPGPRVVALCGLGGAGKTSVAVEYAHRHLAEVGVCWQFPAEDPAVLAAEFARAGRPAGGAGGGGCRGIRWPRCTRCWPGRGRVAAGVRQRAGPGVGGAVRAARRARAGADHHPEPALAARPGAGGPGSRHRRWRRISW